MTHHTQAHALALEQLTTDIRDALPKFGEPEDVWCILHARDLRFALELLAALAEPAQPPVQAVPQWVSVDDRMPEPGVTVLASYLNSNGLPRRIRAKWVKAGSCESSPESDIGEYDEASDTYYDPEGWYEQIDNWDDYTAILVDAAVSHWMPMPAAPTPGAET